MSPEYKEIPVDQIVYSPFNTRGEVSDEEISGLAETMKGGNDVPIKVRPIYPNGKLAYEVVYGERRVKALKKAGIATARAIVEDLTDAEVLMQQWNENEEHKDISDYAKALKLKQILDVKKINQTELSHLLGKDQSWVSRYIKMLSLEQVMPRGIIKQLTEKQARAILAAPPEVADQLYADIKEQFENEGTIPSATDIQEMAIHLAQEKAEEDAIKCESCKHHLEEDDTCDLSDGECTYEKADDLAERRERARAKVEATHEHVYDSGSTTCRICGRELTAPESVKAGIGPVCATGQTSTDVPSTPERFPGEHQINQAMGIEPKPPTQEEKAFALLDDLHKRFGEPIISFMNNQLMEKLHIYRPDSDHVIARYKAAKVKGFEKPEPEIPFKLVEVTEEESAQLRCPLCGTPQTPRDLEEMIGDYVEELCQEIPIGLANKAGEVLRRHLK